MRLTPTVSKAIRSPPSIIAALPVWDALRRELSLGGVLVKRFRQPAKNQEMILAAFQEEHWPPLLTTRCRAGTIVMPGITSTTPFAA